MASGDSLRVPGFANSQKVADAIDALSTVYQALPTISTSLNSAGTTINDATVLTSNINTCSVLVSANEGVKLPNLAVAQSCTIANTGPLGFKVYPHSGSVFINSLGAGVAYTLAANTAAVFTRTGSAQWWLTSVS